MIFSFFQIIFWLYLLVALLPAAYLLIYIYRLDRIEPEPISLIVKLIVFGCISALLAAFIESVGQSVFHVFFDASMPGYIALYAFIVVAVAEEGMKYLFLIAGSWNSAAFNYRFDGVIYAVSVSVGFAALENVLYVFQYGLRTGFARAFLAIPAHVAFAVLAGIFYGRAKEASNQQQKVLTWIYNLIGYILAVVLHGLYDTAALSESSISMLGFIVVVVIIYIIVFKVVRKEANADHPI